MKREQKLLLMVVLWAALFSQLSFIMTQYEQIMNYGKVLTPREILLTGAVKSNAVPKVNLFSEGVIGYGLLAGLGAVCFMFFKDLFSLQKLLQSLYNQEVAQTLTLEGGEKFV